ncbi:MAG: MFS transporter, partial [Clostridia bacterium]|nr:MFS transporter [Clostridia bacterium]
MKNFNNIVKELRGLRCFTVLWITQSLSALGSAMTNFALIIWLYGENGSAAETAMLSVCSYAPYVAVSIFAGALIDKWNKKAVMLVCDAFAALCTAAVLVLLTTDRLRPYHLYVLNTLNSLMNTIQQPASEVAVTALVPKKHFQRIGAMKAFSNSLIGIFAPVLSSAILAFWHMSAVIAFDLASCFVAEAALLFFVKIPRTDSSKSSQSIL